MDQGKKSMYLYIGIEGGGDLTTNEMIYRLLETMNLSKEFEGKKYKGEKIKVWKVTSDFVKTFYASQWNLKLKIVVYIEINSVFKSFPLLDPKMKKKAKQAKILKNKMRKKR